MKKRLEPSLISPEVRHGGLTKGSLAVLHRQVRFNSYREGVSHRGVAMGDDRPVINCICGHR